MPMGGGDPKVVGDGQVVVLRPDATRGNADIWDMKDVVVALIEERENFRAALAGAIDYAAFQAAVAALPRWVRIIDSQNDTP